MTNATAEKTRKKTTRKPKKVVNETEQLRKRLESAEAELATVKVFFNELDKFSNLVGKTKVELKKLLVEEHELKEQLADVRKEIKSSKDLINCSNDGMLSILEPGPAEFMPLFDRMERADVETHGENAIQWREEPVSVLRLSPIASTALIEAKILFIGQLQDMILADPEEWWEETAGLTEAIAAAIADKLNAFIQKGGQQ